jgi:hypothetical protein
MDHMDSYKRGSRRTYQLYKIHIHKKLDRDNFHKDIDMVYTFLEILVYT